MNFKNFNEAISEITYLADLADKVFNDKEALSLTQELFKGTVAVPFVTAGIAPGLAMELCIADECLQHVFTAIAADGKVEVSELDDAWEIVQPLAGFYSKTLPRYKHFAGLTPEKVGNFISFHTGDAELFGGRSNDGVIVLNLNESVNPNAVPIAQVETTFKGGCLVSCLSALCSKRQLLAGYNDIINYVMLKILSDDHQLQTHGITKESEKAKYLWSNTLRSRLADFYSMKVDDRYDDPRLLQARRRFASAFRN